jgi:hypothetical protein
LSKTVEEGFRIFHARLTPTATETEAAKSHRASIETCLKNNFEITRFFRAGSFGNGTSIRNFSDVDYLACIPTRNLEQDSRKTLYSVWDALDDRFPSTGVGIKTPAIQIPFGTDSSESTDIVPADYLYEDDDGNKVYEIADGGGGWMKTSPDAHNAYVAEIDKALGYKVKPLIRFIKAWKFFKNVRMYSFYLEMVVAKYAAKEQSIVYSIDITNIFNNLRRNELSALQDPVGISGYIHPCYSQAMKDDALSKLETAATRAEKARQAERDDEIADAFDWWDLLYDGGFPAY